MHRKSWGFGLSILLAICTVASARPKDPLPSFMIAGKSDMKAVKIIGLDVENQYNGEITPDMSDYRGWDRTPNRDPLGEEIVIGSTWYDYQHNGSIGKMIAKDVDGGIHFVWMKGYDAQQATRHVVWNFLENDQLLYDPDDVPVVDNGSRSGYTNLALLPSDQRTMVFYHVIGPPDHAGDYVGTAQGYDFDRGFGAFNSSYPNPWPNTQLIWPHGTVSRNNFTHLLSTENGDFPAGAGQLWQRVSYWRGEPDRGFENWGWNDPAIDIDTSGTISAVAASSVTSNRVVLATFHNRVGSNLGAWDAAPGWWQKNNDIQYIVSQDGRNFDFQRGMKSLTKIIPPRPELAEFDMNEAYGDTFRPYCDMDIQFDPWGDDNLYAVFPTAMFQEEPVEDDDPEPADGATAEHCILWFWSEHGGQDGQDTITMVYDAYYFNRTDNGGTWHSRAGAWRMNADRGSIAFDPDREGTIYITWVSFPKIQELNPDYDPNDPNSEPFLYDFPAQDTSALGYKAAEIMISVSTDYGITWREPVNATETFWEGNAAPEPGQMASEAWQSVATAADGFLHLAYVRDTEAGGTIQTPSEGPATNSPWIYQKIDINDIPLNDPVVLPSEDFTFHNNLDFRPQIDDVLRNPGAPTPGNQVMVTAAIVGGGDHAVDNASIIYRVNGENEREIAMATVDGDVWGATIPAQAAGSTVWYRIRGVNDVGLPAIAPQANWWWGYVVRNNGELVIRDLQERPDDWETDYSFYRGYEVTVTGVVTTPSTFNEVYGAYAIQDGAAAWSGIFVRGVQQNLNLGDRVTVTGTVFERDMQNPTKWEFETYIQASSVEVIAQGQALPATLRLAGISDLLYSNGVEALEGCLVELRNPFEVDSLNNPVIRPENRTYWPITDSDHTATGYFTSIGLTANDITTMGLRDFARGTEISGMKGVLCENNGRYAIAMRNPNDLGLADVDKGNNPTPFHFALNQAYPNPFNGLTTLSFSLPRMAFATLGVYDLNGREVARVAEGRFQAGQHLLTIDASELATGLYVIQLESNGRTASQKIVLVK